MIRNFILFAAVACAAGSVACVLHESADDVSATSESMLSQLWEGSPEAKGVLQIANTYSSSDFVNRVGLPLFAARNIERGRFGADGIAGTSDDHAYATIAELDAVPGVGDAALAKLLQYAKSTGAAPPDPVATPYYMRYSPEEAQAIFYVVDRANPRLVGAFDIPDSLGQARASLFDLVGGLRGPFTAPPGGRVSSLADLDARAPGTMPFILAWATSRGVPNVRGDEGDLFDPASCQGSPLSTSEIFARFASGELTAPLGRYQLGIGSRECVQATGCGAWRLDDDVYQGTASLALRNDRPQVILEDDRTCDNGGPGSLGPRHFRNQAYVDNGLSALYEYSYLGSGPQGCQKTPLLGYGSLSQGSPTLSGKLSNNCLRLAAGTMRQAVSANTDSTAWREYQLVVLALF